MRKINEAVFAAIDFESSGLRQGGTEVPIQVGVGVWTLGEELRDFFMSYLSVGGELKAGRNDKHRITNKELEGAPLFLSLWPEMRGLLQGRVLVAHGHGTEKRFLRAFPGHGFGPWVDTLLLARAAWPEMESHALGDVCEELGLVGDLKQLVPDKTWHDALFDAVGSLVLLRRVVEDLELESRELELLLSPDLQVYHKLRRI